VSITGLLLLKKADAGAEFRARQLSAKSGLMHRSKNTPLLDHLIGAQPNRWGYGKAERLAVMRFTTISNFVGNCTGRSPGFSPRNSRTSI
jgi:hypothetical protein